MKYLPEVALLVRACKGLSRRSPLLKAIGRDMVLEQWAQYLGNQFIIFLFSYRAGLKQSVTFLGSLDLHILSVVQTKYIPAVDTNETVIHVSLPVDFRSCGQTRPLRGSARGGCVEYLESRCQNDKKAWEYRGAFESLCHHTNVFEKSAAVVSFVERDLKVEPIICAVSGFLYWMNDC